jgi:hypothetical protein
MKAGVYDDLPEQEYLADTEWLSSSMLKAQLPEYYRPFTGSDAADFGTAFHTRILGNGRPIVPVVAASWQGKAAQESRTAIDGDGGIAVLDKDLPMLDAMEAATRSHAEAADLLFKQEGRSEVSVFAEVDGIPCKCRFDRLLDGTGVDVKTTAVGPGEYTLAKVVIDRGYDVSADHYLRVASAAGLDVSEFKLVFVSKIAPDHYVTVVDLDTSFYDRAAVLRELALERYQHPEMVDQYVGQSERLTLTLPRWATL